MQFNNGVFGEVKDALTRSLYNDDYGIATHTPIDTFFLVVELASGDKLLAETGENLVSENSM
jgi:hypothetical protein